MIGRALERGRIGQHRETSSTSRGVVAGECRRIEVGADQATGRARLLDLGDQRVIAMRDLGVERGEKSAHGRGGLRRGLDLRARTPLLRARYFLALIGFDFFQNVAHDIAHDLPFEMATSFFRRSLAAPLSIDFPASLAPSAMSRALPATTRAAAAFIKATS